MAPTPRSYARSDRRLAAPADSRYRSETRLGGDAGQRRKSRRQAAHVLEPVSVSGETALEKVTASRGLLAVQYNEADLFGYTDENADAADAFLSGRDAFLDWQYGLEITRLVMATYMSAERGQTIDLTDPAVLEEPETYVPLIQQGRAKEVLHVP